MEEIDNLLNEILIFFEFENVVLTIVEPPPRGWNAILTVLTSERYDGSRRVEKP